MVISRRRTLQLSGLVLAERLQSGVGAAFAADQPATGAAAAPLAPLNRFPHMVQEYFVTRVRAIEQAAEQARQALQTRADAEAYVASVRTRIRALFGPQPPRTPLRPKVTGRLERDTYAVEKVIFESRPGFFVTANLYLPKGESKPRPGVVGSCGHSLNGKAHEAYQAFSQGLARLGYVVLIFDPIGQGERSQSTTVEPSVRQHLHFGNQQVVVGESFAAWRAWDGIRALDYLLTRPEVDARHVGVTGCSGGGTMTTWLCALDDRWTMAAPDCFVTTFRRNLENELPSDTEQYPPGVLAAGIDHSDFLAAMAPRPIIVIGKNEDFFDARGTAEAHGRLRRLYALLGAPDRVQLFTSPGTHGYAQEGREAMYRWFNRWSGASAAQSEPTIVQEKDEDLWCAPRGQVAALPGARSVFAFTRSSAEKLARSRPRLAGPALVRAVTAALKLPAAVREQAPPDFRILRDMGLRRYPKGHAAVYAVETEPGISVLAYRLGDKALESQPPRGRRHAVLYVADRSSDEELRSEPLAAEVLRAEPDSPFFACDLRGTGESQPDTCGRDSFLLPYGSDYFYAGHSLMLDRPYLGQRTYDLLRVLQWLDSYGHDDIHLVARRWGALPATFAALLAPTVTRVTLKSALASYTGVATTEMYGWPLSSLLPGVLRDFDLPDCYRALGAKKLRSIQPSEA